MIAYHVVAAAVAPGGPVEHRIREEILSLREAGHQPLLIGAPALAEQIGAGAIAVRSRGPLSVFAGSGLADQVKDSAKKLRPELLHAHGWDALRPAHAVAKDLGVPLIADLVETPTRGRHDAALAALADLALTPAASVAQAIAALRGDAASTRVCPGALDRADLSHTAVEPLMLPAGREFLLVFAPLADGHLEPLLAGLDTALAANAALHVLMMGQPIGADAMKAISARGLVSRVTFGGHPPLGFLSRLVDGARAILFAIPDPGVVEPYALLALASQSRIVSTESAPARDVLADHAHYVGPSDAIGLGAALLQAMKAPKRDEARLSSEFSRAALGERLLSAYRSVAAR
jgi:hypothetical protein